MSTSRAKAQREHSEARWVAGCPTGKRGYLDKAGAKRVARKLPPNGASRPRAYRCKDCAHWHVGHIPTAVVAGRLDRREVYTRPGGPDGRGRTE